jgi:hypothetical protein
MEERGRWRMQEDCSKEWKKEVGGECSRIVVKSGRKR